MTVVGITGAGGFLGWHIRCRLRAEGIEAATANRETFADDDALDAFIEHSDLIVHAAGVNRDDERDDVEAGNRWLADRLVGAMERTDHWSPVVYTNSTQSEAGTAYGEAKQSAAARLGSSLNQHGAPLVDLVLPHLFGEYGHPFYNSAVSTFAHLLATRSEPTINPDGRLELLHAQDVAAEVVRLAAALDSVQSSRQRLAGHEISIPDAWDLLASQHHRYVEELTVPTFDSRFELQMFNMLRSQLDLAGYYPVPITRHGDDRGAFSELCRADGTGQTSISTSKPGITRGDHYHLDKIERFVVVDGEGVIRLRRLFTDEIREYRVCGEQPTLIDMPPLVTHNITNVGGGMLITMFWAGDHFDPDEPDTFFEPVEASS